MSEGEDPEPTVRGFARRARGMTRRMRPGEDAGPVATVTLRPLGSAMPIGMAGHAVASLLSAGLALHWVARADAGQIGLLLVVTVVPMQALAAIFALLSRDTPSAAAMSGSLVE